jgi:hypothetical protein
VVHHATLKLCCRGTNRTQTRLQAHSFPCTFLGPVIAGSYDARPTACVACDLSLSISLASAITFSSELVSQLFTFIIMHSLINDESIAFRLTLFSSVSSISSAQADFTSFIDWGIGRDVGVRWLFVYYLRSYVPDNM